MNEIKRTLVFVAIAVVITAITYFTLPKSDVMSPADMVGQNLFPNFEDPLVATSLEVVKFDQTTATPASFMVKKEGNSWVIPPKNYPADAEDQLAKAAADLIDLEVLSVAADPEEAGVGARRHEGPPPALRSRRSVGSRAPRAGKASAPRELRDKDDAKLREAIVGKRARTRPG